MLENDRMETASTEVTLIWRRNDIEKSTWKTHQYFVDFESRIHVEISTSNRYHNFHVDSPFKTDVIFTNFPRGISTWNRWRINKDVSIGYVVLQSTITLTASFFSMKTLWHCFLDLLSSSCLCCLCFEYYFIVILRKFLWFTSSFICF